MSHAFKTMAFLLVSLPFLGYAQTPDMDIRGQVSMYYASPLDGSAEQNPGSLRYLPQLRLDSQVNDDSRLGFDLALDAVVQSIGDSIGSSTADLYRFTLRLDTPRNQVRLGLQKINFGPARMLRVLQWFDQLDPRDPLALSPGVWALMGRHYFDNGANLRLWTMADAPDPLRDITSDPDEWPWDLGGRLEYPVLAGTAGLTFHSMDLTNVSGLQENRLAVDLRLDAILGLWTEMMFSHTEEPYYRFDQVSIMGGVDYTFAIGNGLYAAAEYHTLFRGDLEYEMPWQVRTTAVTMNYTIGLSDALTAYLYAVDMPILDSQFIPMFGWQHTQGNWLYYLAVFDMPEMAQGGGLGLPSGTGIQLNIAFNH